MMHGQKSIKSGKEFMLTLYTHTHTHTVVKNNKTTTPLD